MPGAQQSRSSHALPLPTQRVAPSPVAPSSKQTASDPYVRKSGSRLESALDVVDDAAKAQDSPDKAAADSDPYGINDPDIDSIERRRRQRAQRRAKEAEEARLEQERLEASLERRRKEREARRSQRKY